MCVAHAVAVGDGRQPLDVGADKIRNDPRLCLAELRKLGRDMSHGAVVLAQLAATGDGRSGGSVALGGQGAGQRLGSGERLVTRVFQGVPASGLERGDLAGSEFGHGPLATVIGDPAQC